MHDFAKLVNLAGLAAELKDEQKADPIFAGNWGIVSQWNESSRYDEFDRYTAHQFLTSIDDADHGVYRWLKRCW